MATKSQPTKSYSISPALQKLLIIFSIVPFVVQTIATAYSLLSQYPTNTNFSAFGAIIIQGTLVPVVAFLIPLLFGLKRKMPIVNRVFEATLFALIAALAITAFLSVLYSFPALMYASFGASYTSYLLMQAVPAAAVLVAEAFFVHRHNKR